MYKTITWYLDNHISQSSYLCAYSKSLVETECNASELVDWAHDTQQCPHLCYQEKAKNKWNNRLNVEKRTCTPCFSSLSWRATIFRWRNQIKKKKTCVAASKWRENYARSVWLRKLWTGKNTKPNQILRDYMVKTLVVRLWVIDGVTPSR